jgi:hypothetical protein
MKKNAEKAKSAEATDKKVTFIVVISLLIRVRISLLLTKLPY